MLYQMRKLANVCIKAKCLNFNIAVISKTKGIVNVRIKVDDYYKVIYIWKDKHEYEIVVMANKMILDTTKEIISTAERVILVRFEIKMKPIAVVQTNH